MTLKFKIGLAAAIILAAVLAIFWWPAGLSTAPAPTAALAIKLPTATPPAKPTRVAFPVAPPAAPATAVATAAPNPTTGTATALSGDPQAEIGTAVDDIISLLRSSEILAFYEKYTSPADQAKWSAAQRAEYARVDAMVKANPSADGRTESLIGGFESMKNQTPQMNAAGDEATFQFIMQPPPGMNAPPKVAPMVMVKIDGKWYLKNR